MGVLFCQYYCPGCYTAILSEVVPEDHPDLVDRLAFGDKAGTA